MRSGLSLVALLTPFAATSQVVTDGTVGPALDLGSGEVIINADLGQTRGSNLFHSFSQFDLQAGFSATFTSAQALDHVVARVTGGAPSLLDGTLRSAIAGADLILANPSGLVFGPNFVSDVPAGFHATTADAIGFEDGTIMLTSNEAGLNLSIAAPASFGFLDASPAAIQGFGASFGAAPLNRLSLSGGDISLDGGSGADSRLIGAFSGDVSLSSVGGPSIVDFNTGEVSGPGGAMTITGNTAILVTGNSAGSITIDAGGFAIEASSRLLAGGDGSGAKIGNISVNADEIDLSGQSSIVLNNIDPDSPSGAILLQTGDLSIRGISRIANEGLLDSASGDILINARSMELLSGGTLSTSTLGAGDAGLIDIVTGSFLIDPQGVDAFTGITASSLGDAATLGAAGRVSITADQLDLRPDASISATNSGGSLGGSVVINANALSLDGRGGNINTAIDANATGAAAPAGSIEITSDLIDMQGGSLISANSQGSEAGGSIRIEAGRLIMDGDPDRPPTQIAAVAAIGSTGAAGDIVVNSDEIEISRGAIIQTNSFGLGAAGQIDVNADRITIEGFGPGSLSGILSQALVAGSAGAGQVNVTAIEQLSLLNGALIGSDSASFGAAGGVLIEGGDFLLSGQSQIGATSVVDQGGAAGDVVVNVRTLTVDDGAFVATIGAGAAGGRIDIQASERVLLSNGTVITTGIVATDNVSTISIQAPQIVLNQGSVFSTIDDTTITTLTQLNAGNAAILGGTTIASTDSLVLVSNQLTVSGLDAEIGNDLAIEQAPLVDTGRLLQASCESARPEASSSFVDRGSALQMASPVGSLGSVTGISASIDCEGSS